MNPVVYQRKLKRSKKQQHERILEQKQMQQRALAYQKVVAAKEQREIKRNHDLCGWSMEDIQQLIRDKIHARTRSSKDQYRVAYRLFGRPQDGITLDMFKETMGRLGINLTKDEIVAVFTKYDTNGSGLLDFYEFARGIHEREYPAKPWEQVRSEEIVAEDVARRKREHIRGRGGRGGAPAPSPERNREQFPDSLHAFRWGPTEVIKLIQEKMQSRILASKDQYRAVYRLFGRPQGGITRSHFKRMLANKCGLALTDDEVSAVFKKFDKSGTGYLNFKELVDGIMPPDYTRTPWTIQRSIDMENPPPKVVPDEPCFPESLKEFRWTERELEKIIQEKLLVRIKRGHDQYRTAFALFGRPQNGITLQHFQTCMGRLGVSLTDQETQALFLRYDTDGSGYLDFSEFCACMMPKDYDGPQWSEQRSIEFELAEDARRLGIPPKALKEEVLAPSTSPARPLTASITSGAIASPLVASNVRSRQNSGGCMPRVASAPRFRRRRGRGSVVPSASQPRLAFTQPRTFEDIPRLLQRPMRRDDITEVVETRSALPGLTRDLMARQAHLNRTRSTRPVAFTYEDPFRSSVRTGGNKVAKSSVEARAQRALRDDFMNNSRKSTTHGRGWK